MRSKVISESETHSGVHKEPRKTNTGLACLRLRSKFNNKNEIKLKLRLMLLLRQTNSSFREIKHSSSQTWWWQCDDVVAERFERRVKSMKTFLFRFSFPGFRMFDDLKHRTERICKRLKSFSILTKSLMPNQIILFESANNYIRFDLVEKKRYLSMMLPLPYITMTETDPLSRSKDELL